MSKNLYRVFRRGDTAATSMDWAVKTGDEGLSIRYGPSGGLAVLTEVPLKVCADGSAAKEARLRIAQKVKDGYRQIGCADYVRGRLVLSKDPADADDELFWEIRPPQGEPLDLESSEKDAAWPALIREIVAELIDKGVPARLESPDGKRVAGLTIGTPDGDWAFGLQSGGGLNADPRGGGIIRRVHGVAPILVLIRIEREFPGTVTFADANARAVDLLISPLDPWVGDAAAAFEHTQSLAAALRLCPAAMPVVIAEDGPQPMWF